MPSARFLGFSVLAATAAALFLHAQQSSPRQNAAVKISAKDIGGTVTSPNGAEAGVWVIAETTDLPTRYIKEVVTNDKGQFVVPDLPSARYTVWARGYGLVDSPKITTEPGKLITLQPTVAPDRKTAAQL